MTALHAISTCVSFGTHLKPLNLR